MLCDIFLVSLVVLSARACPSFLALRFLLCVVQREKCCKKNTDHRKQKIIKEQIKVKSDWLSESFKRLNPVKFTPNWIFITQPSRQSADRKRIRFLKRKCLSLQRGINFLARGFRRLKNLLNFIFFKFCKLRCLNQEMIHGSQLTCPAL